MRNLTKDFVTGEIINTVSLMQLNNEKVPILEGVVIEEIADNFIFSWNELGDWEADFDRTLLEHLREEFHYNRINYSFKDE